MKTKYVFNFIRKSIFASQGIEKYSFSLSQESSESDETSQVLPFTLNLIIPLIQNKIDEGYEFVNVEKHTDQEVLVSEWAEEGIRERLNLTENKA